jgi:hypothetical protein
MNFLKNSFNKLFGKKEEEKPTTNQLEQVDIPE